EHERLAQHLGAHVVAVADFQRAHRREVDDLVRLDWPGHAPAQARLGLLRVAPEGEHDAARAGVDDVEAAREPDDHDEGEQHARAAAELRRARAATAAARRLVAAAALAEELGQAPVEVAPQLVEVRRTLVAAAGSLWAARAA